jgi:hypothetical protein
MMLVCVDGEALHFRLKLLTFDEKFDEILQIQLATNDRLVDFENNVRRSCIILENKLKQVIQVQQAEAVELEVSPTNELQEQVVRYWNLDTSFFHFRLWA